ADPAANAESVLRMARDCHDENVALAVFPELTLSGYSIEDILLQDALLDAVEDALLDIGAASAELQQRVLQENVLDRIPGQGQLGEYRQGDVLIMAVPGHPKHRLCVGRGIGQG